MIQNKSQITHVTFYEIKSGIIARKLSDYATVKCSCNALQDQSLVRLPNNYDKVNYHVQQLLSEFPFILNHLDHVLVYGSSHVQIHALRIGSHLTDEFIM